MGVLMYTLLRFKNNLFTSLICLFVILVLTSLATGSTRPMLLCPKTDSPPRIDGQIIDACWKKATHILNFLSMNGDKLATEQSEVYICYDKENLYIAFKCYDSQMDKIKADKTSRDSDVWTDDCVDVFLDPDLSRRYFYQLIVNTLGTQQDINMTEVSDNKWNIKWLTKSHRDKDYWSIEISVPFTQLGLKTPTSGERWGANFNRESPRTPEYSGWVPTGQGFQIPTRFGDLVFTDGPGITFGIDKSGENSATVNLNVNSSDSAPLLVEINTISANGPKVTTHQAIKQAELGKMVEIPCQFTPTFVFNVTVKNTAGKNILYQSPNFPFTGNAGIQINKNPVGF